MDARRIFHLSLPVADLDAARRFYADVLGARIGRQAEDWIDVLLWGHQITLQHRPSEVLGPDGQGKRHFGVVLPWDEWPRAIEGLRERGATLLAEPRILHPDAPDAQAKCHLADPSHNVIEIKAYRDVAGTLGLPAGPVEPVEPVAGPRDPGGAG